MTHSLPLPADLQAARQMLETLWNLVPRSARPLHKSLRENLDRTLEQCVRLAETRATSAPVSTAGSGQSDDGEDDPPLVIVMRMMRSLTPEQFLQVRLLMMMRELSDEGRFEVFEEISGSHHLACGGEIFPDEPHECELDAPESGDDSANDDEDGESGDADAAPEGNPTP